MAGALGIRPDLVTYGKVIGGGFPVAAYAGRADLMDLVAPVGPVYQAGTLSANPVGMRAGLATLSKMERLDGWRVLERADGAVLRATARATCARERRPSTVVQHASIFWLARRRRVARCAAWTRFRQRRLRGTRRFFHAALRRGVYLPPAAFEVCFLSHGARRRDA